MDIVIINKLATYIAIPPLIINFVSADPGAPLDVFAIQIEHIMNNCIVAAFWEQPVNTSARSEIRYKIYANQTFVSDDSIFNGISDGRTKISTLLSVPGCFVHYINVSAVNVCNREGPRSSSIMLDPDSRHIAPNVSNSNTAPPCVPSGNNGKGIII